MKYIFAAISFLTILPIKNKSPFDKNIISGTIMCFPLVGLLIGLILAGTNSLLSHVFPPLMVNFILVTVLIIITGGLHMDGLADTFDGISGGYTREKILEIMKDSHIGAMGVLSLIIVFSLKVSFLAIIPEMHKTAVLLLLPVIGRWSMVLPMYLFKYPRVDGKAKIFFANANLKVFFTTSTLTIIISTLIFPISGLYVMVVSGVTSLLTAWFINSKINGITGDTLGAINEISEIAFLCSVYIFIKYGVLSL